MNNELTDWPLDFSLDSEKQAFDTSCAIRPSRTPDLCPTQSDRSALSKNTQNGTEPPLYYVQVRGQNLVCLDMDGKQRLCLAQISSTLLKDYSYNEIHNRRVALGITCVQCSPGQLETLRESGAMPASSRRCGTITLREAERLVKSFLDEPEHPRLPENFAFDVIHHCGWGCRGQFSPARYNSSRAKCVRCSSCQTFLSPNKFIFHSHVPHHLDAVQVNAYRHPDAANFNAWRRHLFLDHPNPSLSTIYAWEDVKAMFNGGNRKRYSTQTKKQQKSDETIDLRHQAWRDVHRNPNYVAGSVAPEG
ncbi:uncharacterized protein DEA37_0013659, partial [Paragonimus westermani]